MDVVSMRNAFQALRSVKNSQLYFKKEVNRHNNKTLSLLK
jgi:hypothetical protein